MKKIPYLISVALLFVAIGGYGFGEWVSGKADNTKVAKADTSKKETKAESKTTRHHPQFSVQAPANLSGPEQQIYVLNHSKIDKLEYQNFQQFLTGALKYWNSIDTTVVASVIYPKYFSEHTDNSSMKKDMLSVKNQAEKVIKNNKDPKDVEALKSLIENLNEKYN